MILAINVLNVVLSFPLWGTAKTQERFLSGRVRKRGASFLCFLLFSFTIASGQIANYVSNGSFEQILPNAGPYAFEATIYWGAPDTTKSSNYLCSILSSIGNAPYVSTGFQFPRTGNNFIGTQFYCDNCNPNSREYPRNRLKQTLQTGKTYCAKYYIVNTNNNRVAINTYGMYFGDSSIDTITKCMKPITYLNPQIENASGIITDTLNWVPITGTFVATGNEKYIVLGNFRSNAATATLQLNTPSLTTQSTDLYIDDVSVIDIDLPAYAGPDIWGIPTNTVYLGRPQDVGIDEACMWFHLPNTTTAIDTAAGITVTVATTTQTYMVKQDICGNIKYDTVIVYASATDLSEQEGIFNNINLYPNPANDELNIAINARINVDLNRILIYNSIGQLIREEEIIFKNNSGFLNTTDLPNGVYYLNLKGINKRFVIAR